MQKIIKLVINFISYVFFFLGLVLLIVAYKKNTEDELIKNENISVKSTVIQTDFNENKHSYKVEFNVDGSTAYAEIRNRTDKLSNGDVVDIYYDATSLENIDNKSFYTAVMDTQDFNNTFKVSIVVMAISLIIWILTIGGFKAQTK